MMPGVAIAEANDATKVQGTENPWRSLEVGSSFESLTNNLPSWRSSYLRAESRAGDGAVYGGWRTTERYGLTDEQLHVGAGAALGKFDSIQVEGGYSGTQRVLPGEYLSIRLEHKLAAEWVVAAGWQRSAYVTGMTGVAQLSVDHYRGNERFSYTLYAGRPDGSDFAVSHRLNWAHHYTDTSWVGLTVVHGNETENTGSRFLTSRISGQSVNGVHWYLPDWALVWEAGRQRQGDAFTRSGIQLGLRHTF